MSDPATKRSLILGGALLATLIASVWPRAEDRSAPEVVAPVAREDRAAPEKPPPQARIELPKLDEHLARAPATARVEDLFAATSWDAARRSKAAAPSAPAAPPFPYAIAGTLVDGNGLIVMFTRDGQSFVARAGDMLDENYRVEAINAQSVTITYVPLKITQVLPMGAVQ